MIHPELRQIYSSDLEPPDLPSDPRDCAVVFQAVIGPRGEAVAEAYSFTVATPAHFTKQREPTWGRGYLIVDLFEWSIIVRAVAGLLARCARPSWDEVAVELNKALVWEFDSFHQNGA